MEIPQSLAHKMDLFKQTGKVVRENDELFAEVAWQQVMIGQGLLPDDYGALADSLTNEQLAELFSNLKTLINSTVEQLPSHTVFLSSLKPK